MGGESLPVVVIGLGSFGRLTLQALSQIDTVRVVGVSDRNPAAAEQAGKQFAVPAYTDNRSLLAETRPRAAYIATPPMAAVDLIAACAERGIHIWKETPLGRNLDEAAALVALTDQAGLKFAVGTQWRFAAGYRRARQLCGRLGQIFLARCHYLFNWGANLNWRGDKASAGGGALLELGYHSIDILLWLLGFPDAVYGAGVTGKGAEQPARADQPQAIYDTEDTAAAILRYSWGATATAVTTRSSGPVSEELHLHGRGGSLSASCESCLLRDPDGNTLDHIADEPAPLTVFRRQAEAFARAVSTDAKHYECSGHENLLTQAVIEAIYLSDRTSQPENPLRLLTTAGYSVSQCLAYRPPAETDVGVEPLGGE